ncbi:TetR/AcrR family transcriptional regulator [Chitinophaga solisilvae]|uniref:TetR/AcrR family transcriptional regulator n=1 Tax=Chitinophaga solisilvae TaxID=1233460 RepID=UPI00136F9EFF|nr:TetR/AcrR family transcriptional regulator [Chitinophaga solisilvae]
MRARDENKESAIREKAIEMIVNEGFDGLSMHKLAKAAGISASTIYIYFKNREDLLNQLYIATEALFARETLRSFDPEMDFEAGLWLQWQNRYRYVQQYPLHHRFGEQFRNSPLIQHPAVTEDEFGSTMRRFIENAISRKQVPVLPYEIFWALAYGPFYTLVRFHMDNSSVTGAPFALSEATLRETFERTLKALHR